MFLTLVRERLESHTNPGRPGAPVISGERSTGQTDSRALSRVFARAHPQRKSEKAGMPPPAGARSVRVRGFFGGGKRRVGPFERVGNCGLKRAGECDRRRLAV